MRSYSLLFFAALAACSQGASQGDGGMDGGGAGDAGADADRYAYHRPDVPPGAILLETPEFEVAPGAEVTMCSYTTVSLAAPFTTRDIHSYQMPGGHHAAVFYTEVAQPEGVHPCTDQEMTNWRFVGAGAESLESAINLPAGVALQIPGNTQLVVQSHYVNYDTVPHTVRDALTVLPADLSTVHDLVDALQVYDSDLAIPPHATYGRTLECTANFDMNIVTALAHTHQWGTHAKIEVWPQSGPVRQIYDEVGGMRLQFSPPVYTFTGADAVVLHTGDRVRLYCDWENTTDQTLMVPQEMCASLMYYYPAHGALYCDNVIATRGGGDGGVPDSGVVPTGGNVGCDTPPGPTDPCVRPCNTGNEYGVGKYCTTGGGECSGNRQAIICTADVDPTAPGFCTRACSSDATCGSGAVCVHDTAGSGCVPVECVDPATLDGGAGDAGAADAAAD